tara:strand:- start:5325 stop:6032 length:708 start_codon:yes stop_codon:yes gene_type:complete
MVKLVEITLGGALMASVFFIGIILYTFINSGGTGDLKKIEPQLSYEEIMNIKPAATLDRYTLRKEFDTRQFHDEVLRYLINKDIIIVHPALGLISNKRKIPKNVNLIIDSQGGFVSLGFKLKNLFDNLKSVGISFKCYVVNAQSMAFYFMVNACDYVVLKKGGILMQHRVHYKERGKKEYGSYTKVLDLKMAKDEARKLKIGLKEWMKITRGSVKDKVFSEQEAFKYGLIDEVMP